MMGKIPVVIAGVAATCGVIFGQMILPFAFDFLSTLGVYALGYYVGRATKN